MTKLIKAADLDPVFSCFKNDKERIKYMAKHYSNMPIAEAFKVFYNETSITDTSKSVNVITKIELGQCYWGTVNTISKDGITFTIPGIKEDIEYEVEITPKKLQTIPFQTKYIDDNTLPLGTQKQTQYGDNGYKYETYKTLKLNGNVVSSELLSYDNYRPLNKIIRRGTQ